MKLSFRELSWYIEPNRTESNRIEFNWTESNFFNISMFFWVRFDRIELIEIIQIHQIHHVKAFKWFILLHLKYWKNSDPTNSYLIRFGSVRLARKVLEFHCTSCSNYFNRSALCKFAESIFRISKVVFPFAFKLLITKLSQHLKIFLIYNINF